MAKSIKLNFAFNLLHTVVGLLFPIITFPYVSRILMPEGIGQIQFYQSIINYIAIFSALGIPLYAVKEIAKVRDNIYLRSKTAIEVLVLFVSLTLIGYLIVAVLCGVVPKISENIPLFLVLSLHLILVAIGAEWFYQGVEDFKYITIRSLIIRCGSLLALFVFVRDKNDLLIYALLLIIAEAGNNVINFVHLRKYVSLKLLKPSELDIKRHIRPALKIFVLNIIVSIYVNLDSVMLGFMCDNTTVGYYTAATRIARALSGITGALGGVLLPRMANLFTTGKVEEFRELSRSTLNFIVMLTLPMTIGLVLVATELMPIFSGSLFNPAILTLQFLSPLVLFLGLSSIIGTKILYAQDKENIVIKSTVIGALVNLALNFILIPLFSQNGAALASSIAELCVTGTMMVLGKEYIPYGFFNKQTGQAVLACFLMIVPIVVLKQFEMPVFLLLVLEIILASIVYFTVLAAMHNDFINTLKDTFLSFIRKYQ